ncbi:tubby C-terminal-like domain-containing protein [Dioszegia hungarica]|uniref:Tubby C-terminal-like domain-containing protein n=1 Tax=Dioszegia hungarica TaxID=4972 RepID=A0AA38H6D1_9TREE|nr:tubby C-terminal-like domain-containing protein [Dioszegia hungarica]KAI9635387.1 tubby C-terminal-like domain-containing protein [Dioszegia hungarica]
MQNLIFGGPTQQLVPQNPHVAVFPAYCVNGPTTLILKEKAFTFSGDDFQVKDQNGIPVVVCSGKAFSFRDRKVITDVQGRELCHLRSRMMSLRKTFVAEDPQGKELLVVTKKLSFGTKMEAQFTNVITGQPITIAMRGDFWGGSCDITLGEGGPTIAQITRQLGNMREIFTNNQTYAVTVAPGVDLALISALCICLDEAKNEKN